MAEILNSELARLGHDVSVSKWWAQRLLRSLDYSHKTNTGLSGTQGPAVIRCHSEASILNLRQKRGRPRIQKSGKKGSHTRTVWSRGLTRKAEKRDRLRIQKSCQM